MMNNLFPLLIFSALMSCNAKNTDSKKPVESEVRNEILVKDSITFKPDVSINGLLLYDKVTIENQLGDLTPFLNMEEDLPSVVVFDSNNHQYLKLIFHPGSVKNRFSEFEVGYTENLAEKKKLKILKVKEFVTESEIKLGMTKQQIIKKKGDSFIKGNGSSIKYVIDNFEKSSFLKKYNMPLYFAQYEFDKSEILIRFHFGFEYP